MLTGEKRIDIKVGFSCNNNCRFCVQAHNRFRGDSTTEVIKRDLEGPWKEYSERFGDGEFKAVK